jgi:hypothetical protein
MMEDVPVNLGTLRYLSILLSIHVNRFSKEYCFRSFGWKAFTSSQ